MTAASAAGAQGGSTVVTPEDGAAVVLVAECVENNRHMMVAVHIDPVERAPLRVAVRALLEGDGLWCGPAAASARCRAGLLELVTSGGVSAEIVDAAGYDNPAHARAACLAGVAEVADASGAGWLLVARDDSCAATDSRGAAALARLVGASPELSCAHVDTSSEPLVAVAELLVWCWSQGGTTTRSAASVFTAVRVA